MGDVELRDRYCDKHIYGPSGYVVWHEWAEKMSKTHRQVKCKGCNRFMIWIPKRKKASA